MKTIFVYGDKESEHLRLEVSEKAMDVISREFRSTRAGLTQMFDRHMANIPLDVLRLALE